jgi:transcriptional regulator with XRE-family HTH domain
MMNQARTRSSAPAATRPVGDHLREWRQRRRMSQMDLAMEADISTRHLSFVETGRSAPSREMILNLAEQLDIPLRERNVLLVAAGFAPIFPERGLDDPGLASARKAIDIVLAGHEPYPAVALDRHWNLVAHNRAIAPFLEGCDAALLTPPINMLRLSLHPGGIAPRIDNLGEVRGHLMARLKRQIELTADPVLEGLLKEISGFPVPFSQPHPKKGREAEELFVPIRLKTSGGLLTLISATTVFGTPIDVTLAELAIETFLPADAATAEALRRMMPA